MLNLYDFSKPGIDSRFIFMVQRKRRSVKPLQKVSVNTKKIFKGAVIICGVALVLWISFVILPGFFFPNESEEKDSISITAVEVLNGTDVKGIAAEMTEFLRSNKDIDVLITGNSDYTVPETMIIARDKNVQHGNKISELTGITTITYDYVTESTVNVSIILGGDYKKYKPFNK